METIFEINGHQIKSSILKDGTEWMSIMHVCEALDLDADIEIHKIMNDPILGSIQKAGCLPIKYFYGWIFQLNSESEELTQFRMQCYEVLASFKRREFPLN